MSEQAAVIAVAFDYGGVLTVPLGPGFAAWAESEGVDPASLRDALRTWLRADGPADNPVHLLETGRLSGADFSTLLAERLRTLDGRQPEAAGLLERIFSREQLDPPMLELVASLRSRGVRTAMLSNSWDNTYPMDVLEPLFDVVVISGEIGLRKPDPEIYHHTLDALGVRPEQTVFVDDLPQNVEAARELGLHGILHTDHATTATAITDLIPIPEEHPHV